MGPKSEAEKIYHENGYLSIVIYSEATLTLSSCLHEVHSRPLEKSALLLRAFIFRLQLHEFYLAYGAAVSIMPANISPRQYRRSAQRDFRHCQAPRFPNDMVNGRTPPIGALPPTPGTRRREQKPLLHR